MPGVEAALDRSDEIRARYERLTGKASRWSRFDVEDEWLGSLTAVLSDGTPATEANATRLFDEAEAHLARVRRLAGDCPVTVAAAERLLARMSDQLVSTVMVLGAA